MASIELFLVDKLSKMPFQLQCLDLVVFYKPIEGIAQIHKEGHRRTHSEKAAGYSQRFVNIFTFT